jgi:hypothetical protein
VAMALAVLGKITWRRWWGYPVRVRELVRPGHLAAGLAVALAVSVLFFTSFFTHWRGPLDSVLCYGSYLHRSGGAGLHQHPWHYYLKMLLYTHYARGPWWSEAFIMLLALVGFVAVMLREGVPEATTPLARFVAFYTLFLTAIYCVVPYKTPWCLLGFLHGMILLAGVGAVVVVRVVPKLPLKLAACVLLAAGAAHLGLVAYRGSYRFCADRRNPYVYAHSSSDIVRLARRAEAIAALHPAGHDMLVHVVAPDRDYWPLPFYLRRFRRVGYWGELPPQLDAAMIIFAAGTQKALDARLRQGKPPDWKLDSAYQTDGFYGLRPTVHLLAYIPRDLWEKFIATRAAPASP